MPKQGGCARRALWALAASAAVLSVVAPEALAQSTTTATPPMSSFQDECGGGGMAQGYPDATPAEAADLFTSSFPCLLDSLAAEPSDSSGSQASRAQDGGGGDALAGDAAQAPLTTTDASGESVPVDLSLEPGGGGFQPVAPLVDLTLPANLGDQVSFGNQGIAIDAGATDPQQAATASAEPFAGGKGLFYADAAPATDVALAPISHGLEATYQLRAPESPEHLGIALSLPDGSSLQSEDSGGAWVVEGDKVLADFSPPLAFDAAGEPVEATLSVSGDSLDVDLPASDPSTTYPIAVTTTVTSLSTDAPASDAAATIPKLGYDQIQLENVHDPNGNFSTAKEDGNATWFRGGPGMIEDRPRQNAYVLRANTATLNTLYVTAPSGADIDGDKVPDVPTSYSGYQTYCANLATNKDYVDAFEIMNEPNTLVKALDIETTGAQTYALYAYYCDLGIRSVRPYVPILAASTDGRPFGRPMAGSHGTNGSTSSGTSMFAHGR